MQNSFDSFEFDSALGELLREVLHGWHLTRLEFAENQLTININLESSCGEQAILDIVADHEDQEAVDPRVFLQFLHQIWSLDAHGLANVVASYDHGHQDHLEVPKHLRQHLILFRCWIVFAGDDHLLCGMVVYYVLQLLVGASIASSDAVQEIDLVAAELWYQLIRQFVE